MQRRLDFWKADLERIIRAYQRSVLALKLEDIISAKARENQIATQLVGKGVQKRETMVLENSPTPINTREQVAEVIYD